MKKVALFLLAAVLVASCVTAPLSTRIDEYVAGVEANYENWTEEDWQLSQQEYELLLQEYEANYDQLTQEERDAINKAIGRYNGLLVKEGLEEFGTSLKELGEQIPSLLEGFMSVFE